MSSRVNASEFMQGYSAYNIRTNEEVYIAAQCGERDSSNTVWAVEGKNGLYLEYEYNLRDPFYYGD